ncbi:hypothetical protein B0H13DRAFT_1021649 [Mycena leptocephala]|nr:hypothetical protein B0H13DRAFT_1021649 [Mycena leptocephala]
MPDGPPVTPKKKGPAFKPRTPRTPQAPIQKYDPNAPTRPYPVGDYLIVRGLVPTDPPVAPLRQLNRAIDKITDANQDSFEDVVFVATDGPYATCAYVRLHSDHNPTDEDPEPRVDWLEALAMASATNPSLGCRMGPCARQGQTHLGQGPRNIQGPQCAGNPNRKEKQKGGGHEGDCNSPQSV